MPLVDPEIFKNRKIVVQYIAQHYRDDRDDFPMEETPVEVDVTEDILTWHLDDLNRILTAYYEDHELIESVVPQEIIDGPYRVDGLKESIIAFFNLTEDSELTPEDFDAARQSHHIGEEKNYTVKVGRTVTQVIEIPIRATSTHEAKEIAVDTSGDFDFNDGTSSNPEYSIESVCVVKQDLEDETQVALYDSPRQRVT